MAVFFVSPEGGEERNTLELFGKKVTIIVLESGLERPRTYTCSRYLPLGIVVSVVILLAVLAAYTAFLHFQPADSTAWDLQADRFRRLTVKQDLQLRTLSEKVRRLDLEMARLRPYDRKLKAMTGETPGMVQNLPEGLGGAETDSVSPEAALALEKGLLVQRMHRDLDRLLVEAGTRERTVHQLSALLQDSQSIMASTPDIWPLVGPVSSYFGYRSNPFGGRSQEFHRGLDIRAPVGAPIVAPADGVVIRVEWDQGYGLIVVIHHGYGLVTRYAHTSQALVEEGQRVVRGQKIALVGATGRTTGPHLHWEAILNGIPVNPMGYLEARK